MASIKEPTASKITCCLTNNVEKIINVPKTLTINLNWIGNFLSLKVLNIKTKHNKQWPDGKQLTGVSVKNVT